MNHRAQSEGAGRRIATVFVAASVAILFAAGPAQSRVQQDIRPNASGIKTVSAAR